MSSVLKTQKKKEGNLEFLDKVLFMYVRLNSIWD